MRRYSLRITPSAIQDIETIAEFYLEMVDAASAVQFGDDVVATLESLDTFPESNAYFDQALNLRRVQVRNHKVSVVYIVDDGVYEVVAFGAFHGAGKPGTYTSLLVERLKELE